MDLVDKVLFKIFKIERFYAQSGEDRILNHLFTGYGKERILYLDIGANHPLMNSNTYFFYRKGGNGVCVEPNPKLAEIIRNKRPRDICLNVGLGENADEGADFYVMTSHTLSTFSKDEALALHAQGKYRIEEIRKIPLININSIIDENFESVPDLVSIDVEGWNEEIVRSFDFKKYRPFSFCVETITFSENNQEKKLDGILDIFCKNDYQIYADTHINTIFVDRLQMARREV